MFTSQIDSAGPQAIIPPPLPGSVTHTMGPCHPVCPRPSQGQGQGQPQVQGSHTSQSRQVLAYRMDLPTTAHDTYKWSQVPSLVVVLSVVYIHYRYRTATGQQSVQPRNFWNSLVEQWAMAALTSLRLTSAGSGSDSVRVQSPVPVHGHGHGPGNRIVSDN